MDEQNQNNSKKVLIVEDDFYIRDLYLIHAKLMNLDIITAIDGEEALQKIRNHKPAVVLLDLMLPKIDGMNVLKMIRSDPSFNDIKFIITTNVEDSATEQAARDLGAIEYLLKINSMPQDTLEIAQKHLEN
jgi:CheY-like chemotaxis protein